MAIVSHTFDVAGGLPVTIYAETDNINYFLSADLTPDTAEGPANFSTGVAGGSRRQYPGDSTTISVAGSTREFLVDPTRKSSNALPGKSFVLLERGGSGEKRQFTFKGRLMDLHSFLRAQAGKSFYLYGNTGARYTIDQVAQP